MVANDVKKVLPIMNPLGISYFARSTILYKVWKYFMFGMSLIDTIKNNSTGFDNFTIHLSLKKR